MNELVNLFMIALYFSSVVHTVHVFSNIFSSHVLTHVCGSRVISSPYSSHSFQKMYSIANNINNIRVHIQRPQHDWSVVDYLLLIIYCINNDDLFIKKIYFLNTIN